MTVKKQELHHVDQAGGDADKHAAAAMHAFQQIAAGHYAMTNKKVGHASQSALPGGGTRYVFEKVAFDVHPTDPSAPAASAPAL